MKSEKTMKGPSPARTRMEEIGEENKKQMDSEEPEEGTVGRHLYKGLFTFKSMDILLIITPRMASI